MTAMSTNRHVHTLVAAAVATVAVLTIASPAVRSADSRSNMRSAAAEQSAKAAKAFDAIMQVPDRAIPRELLAKARAVAVFPQVVKVAFTIGGEGGRGVVSRRLADGWSSPVFFRGGGASVGAQVGATSTDYVVLM